MCEKETAESDNSLSEGKPIPKRKSEGDSIRLSNNNNCRRNDNSDVKEFVKNYESDASSVYIPFSSRNLDLFSHFEKNTDINMLRQNRTDIFIVNNNNDFFGDKEVTRPDSTAKNENLKSSTSGRLEDRKREHRCFQVSKLIHCKFKLKLNYLQMSQIQLNYIKLLE